MRAFGPVILAFAAVSHAQSILSNFTQIGCVGADFSAFPTVIDFPGGYIGDECLFSCVGSGYEYAALGSSCQCASLNPAPTYTNLDSTICNSPCMLTDQIKGTCGGPVGTYNLWVSIEATPNTTASSVLSVPYSVATPATVGSNLSTTLSSPTSAPTTTLLASVVSETNTILVTSQVFNTSLVYSTILTTQTRTDCPALPGSCTTTMITMQIPTSVMATFTEIVTSTQTSISTAPAVIVDVTSTSTAPAVTVGVQTTSTASSKSIRSTTTRSDSVLPAPAPTASAQDPALPSYFPAPGSSTMNTQSMLTTATGTLSASAPASASSSTSRATQVTSSTSPAPLPSQIGLVTAGAAGARAGLAIAVASVFGVLLSQMAALSL